MLADREGRLEDRPKRIKMEVFPGDDVNVEKGLNELHTSGFVHRYEAAGSRYLEVCAFLKHQNPHHREPPSIIPKPEAHPHLQLGESPRLDADATPQKPEASPRPAEERHVPARLNPSSLNPSSLIPDSGFLIPDSLQKQPPAVADAPAAKPARGNGKGNGKEHPTPPTGETWEAYSTAYLQRHGAKPVRNAKVNSQIKQFVERIGEAESPGVAAFFVGSNRGLYVSANHPVNLLLRDCESLHTEWVTNRHGTETAARQADQTATIGNVFNKLIAESREAKKNGA